MKTKVEVIRKMTSKNNNVVPYTYMVIDDGDKDPEYSVMIDSHAYASYSDLITRLAMEFGSFFYIKDYGVTGWR